MASTSVDSKALHNGSLMPIIGLGVGAWQPCDDAETIEQAVEMALSAGYTHFDTSPQNDRATGNAIRKWLDAGKLKREDLFIVTKLPMTAMWPYRVNEFLRESLKALQMDYVDLYLIQFPVGLLASSDSPESVPRDAEGKVIHTKTHLEPIWKAMENEIKVGRAKAIGVGDFNEEQLDRILKSCSIPPAVLQTEVNVYFQQKKMREYCKENNILVCAYAPLGHLDITDAPNRFQHCSAYKVTKDPVVNQLARKYGRTPGQILLRFLIQSDIIVVPKCLNPFDVKTSIKVCGFTLEDTEMELLRTLDRPDDVNLSRCLFGEIFSGVESHPEYPWKEQRSPSLTDEPTLEQQ